MLLAAAAAAAAAAMLMYAASTYLQLLLLLLLVLLLVLLWIVPGIFVFQSKLWNKRAGLLVIGIYKSASASLAPVLACPTAYSSFFSCSFL